MKILFSATAVAALALATSAFAGDWRSNDYAQINIGSSVAGSTTASSGGVSASADLNPGFLGGGLVGHAFGNGVSVEGELLYDTNQVKDTGGARVESFGGLANIKFEAPTHYKVMSTTVSPYVAGGVGYGDIDVCACFNGTWSKGHQSVGGSALTVNSVECPAGRFCVFMAKSVSYIVKTCV